MRDRLLGLPVHDIDYVVVGSSAQEMIAQGFRPVGSHFPVFLHPQTHHEYALARTERKTVPGHQGFTFHADPSVSLEDDLRRRDLSINAIAQEVNDEGELIGPFIDPYQGMADLEQGVLRHLSDAFAEDPLRILRVARFAARFPKFKLAPQTLALMKTMVQEGELLTLSKERIWQELAKAFTAESPIRFVEMIEECGASVDIWPDSLLKQWSSPVIREQMRADLIKCITHHSELDKRLAIFLRRVKQAEISDWASKLRVPNEVAEFCGVVADCEVTLHQAFDPRGALDLFNRSDVWRKPARFTEALHLLNLLGTNNVVWQRALDAALGVDGGKIATEINKQSSGSNLGIQIHEALAAARLVAITATLH